MSRLSAEMARLLSKAFAPVGYRGIGRLFRPLRRIRSLREVEGIAEVAPGRKIIFPAFDYYWAEYLWTGKRYEPDVQMIFDRLAPIRNKVFIDGGANIGYWTVKLSTPDYNFEAMFAVEANPYVFSYLRLCVVRSFETVGGVD